MRRDDLGYVVLGAATVAQRQSRRPLGAALRVAGVAAWPAARVWGSPLAGPVRRRATATTTGLAHEGRDAVERSRAATRRSAQELVRRLDAQLISSGVVDELIDRLLASERIDRLVAASINHPATQRMIIGALDDPGIDRLIAVVIESRLLDEFTTQLLDSEEMQRILVRVMGSPELRAALAQQTSGLAGDVAVGVRAKTVVADAAAERLARSLVRRRRRSDTP